MAFDIAAFTGLATNTLSKGRGLLAAPEKLDAAQLKLEMTDLLSMVADLKAGAIESADQIRELEAQLELIGQMEYREHSYWNIESNDGPYCQRCFDVDRQAVRLQPRGIGGWQCRQCRSTFGQVEGEARPERPGRGRGYT